MTKILYMVVPCYNEELVLDETSERLKAKYEQLISNNIISPKSRVVYVNDGSKDKTWEKIQEKHNENPMNIILVFAKAGIEDIKMLCSLV